MGAEWVRERALGEPEEGRPSRAARERFEALYQRRYAAVYAYVLRRLPAGSRVDVPDVAAEVFAAAWRCRDQLPPQADELAWLYAIAYSLVMRHRRGRHRHMLLRRKLGAAAPRGQNLGGHPYDPGARDARAELHELVARALETLRPADQEVLRLALWEELSHAEIGRVLGCTANAVAVRLHKARQKLRARLLTDAPGFDGRVVRRPGT